MNTLYQYPGQRTREECPNKCGDKLIMWGETWTIDDCRKVWYCPTCDERTDE